MVNIQNEEKIKLLENLIKDNWRIHQEITKVLALKEGDGALMECPQCGRLCRENTGDKTR